ncbi:unnamed protein product [Brassicogethes aeneus]|uniref:Uncharacterized protein n=1 Tax=Brassicogethes aeneus TaxID=1431903 RepID=A0A9P0B210_BRAAE|nr:unnamed protein product [Brassicogethes aeneus]
MSFPKPSFFPRKKENPKDAKRKNIGMELDMDESVKQIIDSSKKCSSILLDVTVIRPAEETNNSNKKFVTQTSTLNSSQVRKLIASMEMGNHDKSKLLDKIFGQRSNDCVMKISKHVTTPITDGTYPPDIFSSLRRSETIPAKRDTHRSSLPWDRFYKKCNCSGSLHQTLSKISSGVVLNRTSSECCLSNRRIDGDGDQHNMQHIYTTAKSFNLKNVFACKNKNSYENKNEDPCNCQNCAILNVIEDTQKKPMFAGPIEASGFEERRHFRSRKYPSEHAICNLQYTQLTKKINELEERLAAHEERSVAKDYFKRIITKLVTHITKITSGGSQDKIHTTNHYREKYPEKYTERYVDHYSDKYQYRSTFDQRYHVNPMLFSDSTPQKEMKSLNSIEKETCDSNTQSDDIDGFWKWGGEILRPGIDLKNKIVQLMEDYLQRKKTGQPKGADFGANMEKNDRDKEIKIYVDVISNNLHHKNISNASTPVIYITKSGVYKKDKDKLNKCKRNEPDVLLNKKEYKARDVNVAYVNPNIKSWTEYSLSTSLGSSFSDQVEYELCKEKFKEILSNTKTEGKKRLWNTIWNQAVINGQKKNDFVTIQVPNGSNEVMEMYYTIAELENILTNDHSNASKNPRNY